MNQIVNMVMRIVMRKLINKGVDTGARSMSRSSRVKSGADETHKQAIAKSTQRNKQMMRAMRRFGRF
ncbi:hypothetical protein [Pseudaestuariivita rosea]|uniref:hypothetical protein n=1 Tax=Pseudaestuariivita rosea TaxID=2763263 RepID=UPI001ABBD676|nr:hypothetical protein [Pseudaestuariivita rosea]